MRYKEMLQQCLAVAASFTDKVEGLFSLARYKRIIHHSSNLSLGSIHTVFMVLIRFSPCFCDFPEIDALFFHLVVQIP